MYSVECPYCEAVHKIGYIEDSEFDYECECGETFEVTTEIEVTLSGSKIVLEICEECNKEARDPNKRGKVFPFPENTSHNILCVECYRKFTREEYDNLKNGGEK